MQKDLENKLIDFAKKCCGTEPNMMGGSLYVKFSNDLFADSFRAQVRNFMRKNYDKDTGVNMYQVGDEYVFDFVPESRESFYERPEYGVWSEFATEGLVEDIPHDVDVQLTLEAEMLQGK